MKLQLQSRQSPTLSPRLQHAVRLLQLSSCDFAAMLRDRLDSNPFLERDEEDDLDDLDRLVTDADPDQHRSAGTDPHSGAGADPDTGVGADQDSDAWPSDPVEPYSQPGGNGDSTPWHTAAVQVTLANHLHGQLSLQRLDERELHLARVIVESLDDDGYLRTALNDLHQVAPLDPVPTEIELGRALQRVQALDPCGIGARDVAECLRLQLPLIECEHQRHLAQSIVGDHLPLLALRDTKKLARALRAPLDEVQAACDRIRRCDPRPGWRFGAAPTDYVVPDIIVRKQRGQWVASLNPAVMPRVKLNHAYAAMFKQHRQQGQHGELAGQLDEARWTVSNVRQRFSTILDVAQAIVRRQRAFFEHGAMAMKPLGLRDIAAELGVHESTVSRVTNNKFMVTPTGVVELTYFFSRPVVSASGRTGSGTAIRSLVQEIIEREPTQAPLSDPAIARQLAQQGWPVARRTVTKYRQLLKIETVDRRRLRAALGR
jgi:RNA polymerase sigma-54 factor